MSLATERRENVYKKAICNLSHIISDKKLFGRNEKKNTKKIMFFSYWKMSEQQKFELHHVLYIIRHYVPYGYNISNIAITRTRLKCVRLCVHMRLRRCSFFWVKQNSCHLFCCCFFFRHENVCVCLCLQFSTKKETRQQESISIKRAVERKRTELKLITLE